MLIFGIFNALGAWNSHGTTMQRSLARLQASTREVCSRQEHEQPTRGHTLLCESKLDFNAERREWLSKKY